ncbi:hypothetical protein [Natrialba aegyptia]|nr:hypothetical protein [Natrialba aegyptia]
MRRRTILPGAAPEHPSRSPVAGCWRTRLEKSIADDAVGAPYLPDPNR